MEYNCLKCLKFTKYFYVDEDGFLRSDGNHCSLGKTIENYKDAQTCYMFRPRATSVDEMENVNIPNLLIELKHELFNLKSIIDDIEKTYEKNKEQP